MSKYTDYLKIKEVLKEEDWEAREQEWQSQELISILPGDALWEACQEVWVTVLPGLYTCLH